MNEYFKIKLSQISDDENKLKRIIPQVTPLLLLVQAVEKPRS